MRPSPCSRRIYGRFFRQVSAAAILTLAMPANQAADQPFSHADWTTVLQEFVDDRGYVDYEGLARRRDTFDRYIESIETTSPKSDPERFPTPNDALAYYLNAYNALVFKGVLARGPEEKSVWRGLISGYSFFVGMSVVVGGERTNLKKLEDNVIRGEFQDPRIHAALNCASISCPRLPREAFEPNGLDEQLDATMTEFVGKARNVTDDGARTVTLSKIFSWFSGDFLEHERRQGNPDPNLIDYVNRYRPDGDRIPRDYRIRFSPYDKGINKQ